VYKLNNRLCTGDGKTVYSNISKSDFCVELILGYTQQNKSTICYGHTQYCIFVSHIVGPQASFDKVSGVTGSVVGYTGAETLWPTYREIKGHTEALMIDFNPKKVTYEQLLAKFWKEHSPYSNCSGQYMNAVWYYNQEQKAAIDASIASLGGDKVKTTVAPVGKFYRAEEYHQKYYEKSSSGCKTQ